MTGLAAGLAVALAGPAAAARPLLRVCPAHADGIAGAVRARALAAALARSLGRPVEVGPGDGGVEAGLAVGSAAVPDFPGAVLFRGLACGMAPAELAAWCTAPAAREAWVEGCAAAGLRAFPCGVAAAWAPAPGGVLPIAYGQVVALTLPATGWDALDPAARAAVAAACADALAAAAAASPPVPPGRIVTGMAAAVAGEAAADALAAARRAAGSGGAAAFAAWAAARRGEAVPRGHSTSR